MGTLSTTASRDGQQVVLVCSGSAESESVDALTRALDDAHATAVGAAATTVVADLRGLEFATSSCLKVFVSWLQRVQKLESNRYKVVFRSTPTYSWQRRSLGALAAFAKDIVEIRSEAE
jgi:hypothetical protein